MPHYLGDLLVVGRNLDGTYTCIDKRGHQIENVPLPPGQKLVEEFPCLVPAPPKPGADTIRTERARRLNDGPR
jgi:hypothetical protein